MGDIVDTFAKLKGQNPTPIERLNHQQEYWDAYTIIRNSYMYWESLASSTLFTLAEKVYKDGAVDKGAILLLMKQFDCIKPDQIPEELVYSFLSGAPEFKSSLFDVFITSMRETYGESVSHDTIIDRSVKTPNAA